MPSEYSRYEEAYWWSVVRRRIVGVFLGDFIDSLGTAAGGETRILDVGCGSGTNIEALRPLGKTYGIDFSEYEARLAAARAPGSVAVADGARLPFKDGTFGAVTLLDVLEHLNEPGACLEDVARVAGPGAMVIITVPAYQFLYTPAADEDHRRRYSASQLKRTVIRSGLRIVKLSYFNTLLFPLMFVQRMGRKFGPQGGRMEKMMPKYPDRFQKVFEWIFGLEVRPLKYMNFPFGGSVLCICRKPQ